MPNIEANGVNIYYETHGEGQPLLLIMGLGNNLLSWHRTVPELSKYYKVIVFDNRGVGRSDKPDSPYSIELMASDAKAVLDATNIETAHVYGISMGGMIAQRFAISYPERVRSLVLGCTTSGGVNHVQPNPEVSALMVSRAAMTGTAKENAWAAVPILYSQPFIEKSHELIAEDIQNRIEIETPAYAYMRQLQACLAHDCYNALDNIKVPTLVIHGDGDVLVPYENGKVLADKIEGAELFTISGAGHIYVSEAIDEVNNKIIDFLNKQN